MADTKLNTANNIFNKLIKALLLLSGAMWIPLNLYNTNFTFLTSWFNVFVLIGYIILDTFFTSVGLSLIIGKKEAKNRFVQVCIWMFGVAWGLHSYRLLYEHKYFSAVIASVINWISFGTAVISVLTIAGFALYYFLGKGNKS